MKKLTIFLASIICVNMIFAQINLTDTVFYSATLDDNIEVAVYLPPGYDANPDLYYPVIYYLNNWTTDQADIWDIILQVQERINNAMIDPVIVVCANNNVLPFRGSMYVNSVLWGNYEDFMTDELLTLVETNFRAMPGKNYRAVMGQYMGGYGAFRYGVLHKDKFRVLSSWAGFVNFDRTLFLEPNTQEILYENQPGPPYFYDYDYNYYHGGDNTCGAFLFSGAFSPDTSGQQNYVSPQVVNFILNEDGDIIDSVEAKWHDNDIAFLINQLTPADSVGIYFGCGVNDPNYQYASNQAFKDTLNKLGLLYEYYKLNTGYNMPDTFKYRSVMIIDSLLMPPAILSGINPDIQINNNLSFDLYPNPVTSQSMIQFKLSDIGHIRCDVLNYMGQPVLNIFEEEMNAGLHKLRFDASELASGIYFVRLRYFNSVVIRKVVKL